MVDASRKTSAAASAETSSDGEDETRAERAEKAAMAARAHAIQGQRPPQPSTPVVLAHPQHKAWEERFGGRGINLLDFSLICRNIKDINLLGNNAKNVTKKAKCIVLSFLVYSADS
uniref:Uncharacterized protein n=1 Tax=Fagus sylvatica TaxID=28930 RepID=A0A2N9G1V9_FAGSY